MMNIAILGSGISGISCSYHLKQEGLSSCIFEKDNTWGGLLGNFEIDGFRFDRFVHFTFTKNDYVRKIFESKSEFHSHKPEASNYYKGTWLRHPAQNNLYPLGVEEKTKIIMSLINNIADSKIKVNNYEDWLKVQYGDYFSENFPMKYTKKYWTVDAKELETKWVGNRMHKPSIEEVLTGSMKEHKEINYYTEEMRYPKKGGYKSVMSGMDVENLNMEFGKKVVEIDTKNKVITFLDKSTYDYDKLVSSIPITKMVHLVKDTPIEIKKAAGKLLCTSGYLVSLGFNKVNIPKNLWFYIYDEEILPSRVYSPSMKSPDNVPDGCSSLQAEIYFSREFEINMSEEDLLEHVIEKLKGMDIFTDEDLIVKGIRKEEFANVVFNHDIYENRDIVKKYLNSEGIDLIGRFGVWAYLWSDQSFLSGKKIADAIIKDLNQ